MKNKDDHIRNRHFGKHGGRYVPEILIPVLEELEQVYLQCKKDLSFQKEFTELLKNYSGRPTPLYFAENLTEYLGGAKIYLKLEGLNHTGAHKITNAIGQALLAKWMGKRCLVAETGAGQHGLASATIAAKLGFSCKVFMGIVDIKRQYPNVFAMDLLGTQIIPVTDGTKTLKDAVNAALKNWIENLETTYYLLGSVLGPYPYPIIVRDFQSVIGKEIQNQIKEYEQRDPDVLIACVGGGSNSLGMFYPYLKKKKVRLIGIEAGGKGKEAGKHAARFRGTPKAGIVQGYKSYFLQNKEGQILPAYSISAGLDYAGVGPELSYFYDQGRIEFHSVTDGEVLEALKLMTRLEGIIPALESSHAVAYAIREAKNFTKNKIMIINISGRGDKDIFITAKRLDYNNWIKFLKNEIK